MGTFCDTGFAFALQRARKIVRGLKEGLTEEEHYAVAYHVVAQLKERGHLNRVIVLRPPLFGRSLSKKRRSAWAGRFLPVRQRARLSV